MGSFLLILWNSPELHDMWISARKYFIKWDGGTLMVDSEGCKAPPQHPRYLPLKFPLCLPNVYVPWVLLPSWKTSCKAGSLPQISI